MRMPRENSANPKTKLCLFERLLVLVLSWLLFLWWGTLRIHTGKTLRALCRSKDALIFALWHQHLFLAGLIYRRFRRHHPSCAIISVSKDGEWLAELFRRLGISSIRGSSHRGAVGVYNAAIRMAAVGNDICITPDGPRGPKYRCKTGIIRISEEAGIPICAIRVREHCAISLRSWDSFKIPLPFSRVDLAACTVVPGKLIGSIEEQGKFIGRLLG
ncbi:MAG: DUF374 domain-containing protein [Puniceicoccales bacterium]|jgi:lysophospholipid acyltransferase (LPLAT)-like uncharacterized protein|nr:DUF374 domain-containing protein [Puniceicoccales bacterium]